MFPALTVGCAVVSAAAVFVVTLMLDLQVLPCWGCSLISARLSRLVMMHLSTQHCFLVVLGLALLTETAVLHCYSLRHLGRCVSYPAGTKPVYELDSTAQPNLHNSTVLTGS